MNRAVSIGIVNKRRAEPKEKFVNLISPYIVNAIYYIRIVVSAKR